MASIETVDIDPNGDVVLTFDESSDSDGSTHLRVSSVLLSHASPVFKRMFSSSFKEATELATQKKPQVPLPEDDAGLVKTLCNIVHMRHNDVPYLLDEDDLIDFAHLCDKYQCATVVKPSVRVWILHSLASKTGDCDNKTLAEFAKLLRTAQLLDDLMMIKKICAKIILHSTRPLSKLQETEADLPDTLINTLRMYRTSFQNKLMAIATDAMQYERTEQNYSGDPSTCTVGSNRLWYLFVELELMGLWPFADLSSKSLDSLLAALETCNFRDMTHLTSCQPRNHGCRAENQDSHTWRHECGRMRDGAKKLRKQIEDLTLQEKDVR